MGENGLLAPHRVGRAESKPHDGMRAALVEFAGHYNETWLRSKAKIFLSHHDACKCSRNRPLSLKAKFVGTKVGHPTNR